MSVFSLVFSNVIAKDTNLSMESKLEGEIPRAIYPVSKGGKLTLKPFKNPIEVRSLTINFERNTNVKICQIKLLDENLNPYHVKTPEVIKGSVSSDSVLQPVSAYGPIYLFDSRFEYAYASDKKEKNISLNFNFKETQTITKLRIWNGYQRSVNDCYSNSRAKKLEITLKKSGTGS